MTTWNPDAYQQAWNFASRMHRGQTLPGTDLPYINHIANVAMEVMTAIAVTGEIVHPDLAVQCALLHDTIEDTGCTFADLEKHFGLSVAEGVQALSKDKHLPTKSEQMADSLRRIRQQPVEVWMVKLADRITNLQTPPAHWSKEKTAAYRQEAMVILEELGSANHSLATRLAAKIEAYLAYC